MKGDQWSDADDAGLRCHFENWYGISSTEKIGDALSFVMFKHRVHPVRDYLDALHWDGTPRVDTLFVDVLGAEDIPFTRAVTRKFLCAGVARTRNPGCKFDYLLVLEGDQGIGKSATIGLLGWRDKGWFSDTAVPFDDTRAAVEIMSGKLILELGELSGLRKAEVEQVKRFISTQEDTTRTAYAKRPATYPRQCIFVGTTNRSDYLVDPTGNRRFWPIKVDPSNAKVTREEYLTPETIDQIWAEADELFRQGEKLYLPPELETVAAEQQLERTTLDERGSLVKEYLDTLVPVGWYDIRPEDRANWFKTSDLHRSKGSIQRDRVCTLEILTECFGRDRSELDTTRGRQIRDIMSQMKEWHRNPGTFHVPGLGSVRGYLRNTATAPQDPSAALF